MILYDDATRRKERHSRSSHVPSPPTENVAGVVEHSTAPYRWIYCKDRRGAMGVLFEISLLDVSSDLHGRNIQTTQCLPHSELRWAHPLSPRIEITSLFFSPHEEDRARRSTRGSFLVPRIPCSSRPLMVRKRKKKLVASVNSHGLVRPSHDIVIARCS